MPRRLVILSGGQTGVDRAALDAALERGAPCGGWCPQDRAAEDGSIPDRYPLRELPGGGYADRTRRNVRDSDGTLIIHFGPMSGGTALTHRACDEFARPVCLVDAGETPVEMGAALARAFIAEHGIERLNVAGPRASTCAEGYSYAHALITELLESR